MSAENSVEPRTLKGFRDVMPAEAIARERVSAIIRGVYERFGFVPVDTPGLELLGTLTGTGGEEINKTLFRIRTPEGEDAALRFDLTVPFARLLAQYPDGLKLPFRRYQIGPVWRADKPDPGRWREFVQCDIDAAGSAAVEVDAEMVAALASVMRETGLTEGEFRIRINDRKLVDAFLSGSGVGDAETRKKILRVVDKLARIGLENVKKELGAGRVDESGDTIKGVGLSAETIGKVAGFIGLRGDTRKGVLEAVRPFLPKTPEAEAAMAGLVELDAALAALGVTEREAVFDPALARGLDYYTGPVFEAVLPGAPEFGSVAGGGRYDGLAGRFSEARIPATGVSIGLDRFVAALTKMGEIKAPQTTTRVLVVAMTGTPVTELLRVAAELRGAGIAAELYFTPEGAKPGVKNQLAYGNAREIPVAVLLGEDELKAGKISIKDLRAGRDARAEIKDREEYRKAGQAGQVTVDRAKLVETVRGLLGKE